MKKNVVWADVLEHVKEISTTKLAFNAGTSATIKQMFTSIESFMPLSANRNRSLKIDEFKDIFQLFKLNEQKNHFQLLYLTMLSILRTNESFDLSIKII